MDLSTKISLGFDIATAISIMGAAIAFIVNMKKENMTKIDEDQEAERVRRLMEFREIISLHTSEFMRVFGPDSEESQDVKANVLKNTHLTIRSLYQKFMSIIPREDLKSFKLLLNYDMKKFNEGRYLIILIDLEKSLLLRIRKIMNQEEPTASIEEINDYVELYYKGYKDLKDKITKEDTKKK